MRKLSLALTAAVGVTALALAAQTSAGSDAGGIRTQAVIDNYHAEKDVLVFPGVVTSPRKSCEKGRKVQIVAHGGGDPPRQVLGTDRTGNNGRFEVREPLPVFQQSAYAKVKRKRLRTARVCKAARSEDISLSGRAAHRRVNVQTKLKILASRINPDTEVPAQFDMNGRVNASKAKCKRKRTIRLFREHPGPDQLEGTDRSTRRGWFIAGEVPGPSANGTYYVKTSKITRGDVVCSGDRSADHVIDFD